MRPDVWTLFHSYAFDFSVWEIWGALLYGGRLVVVPYWVSRSPEAFAELLERERRHRAQPDALGVPPADPVHDQAASWRCATSCSAARRWSRPVWRPGSPPRREPPCWSTCTASPKPPSTSPTAPLTGRRPAPDAAARSAGRCPTSRSTCSTAGWSRFPSACAGEIFVGGAGVARGYLNRPDLTAERFLPDPFGPPGARLYRTGDLARRLADGSLEYLGRADQQVKVRGFRIEPGEIEAALVRQPGVREAAGARPARSHRRPPPGRLCRDRRRQPATSPAWRQSLGAALPDYMVPAAFVVLDGFPLTHHGKIDRKALPAPEAAAAGGAGEAPATPAEETLAAVWSDVLGVPKVGRDDNFFALGGDSILSLQVVSRARKRGLTLTRASGLPAPVAPRTGRRRGRSRHRPYRHRRRYRPSAADARSSNGSSASAWNGRSGGTRWRGWTSPARSTRPAGLRPRPRRRRSRRIPPALPLRSRRLDPMARAGSRHPAALRSRPVGPQ